MKKILIISILTFLTVSSYTQTQYPTIVFETNKGTIKFLLYDNTFRHSENFVKLVNDGFYNGLLFHRVINNFMIQTGDNKSLDAKPGVPLGFGGADYTLPAEFFPDYYHKKGAIAAARQPDNVNPKKNSSGSQFYIVHGKKLSIQELDFFSKHKGHPKFTEKQISDYTSVGGTPHLDYAYTVFGEVIEGLEIVDKIASVKTDQRNRPTEDILIIKAYTIEK